MRSTSLAAGAVFSLLAAATAWSQVPAGGEFLVNTVTTGIQYYSAAARDSRGNFVLVWNINITQSIVGQRFDRSGARLGAEFVIDNSSTPVQAPAVAMNARGEFLVVWMQDGGPSSLDIHGQVFGPGGSRIGAEFRLNDFTFDIQAVPAAAADGRGDFVVAWWSRFLEGNYTYAIAARKVSRQGVPLGTDLLVNSYFTGNQFLLDVGADAAGNFVVVWSSAPGSDQAPYSVDARRFDASGQPQGASFLVNESPLTVRSLPGVGVAPDGSFVVAYRKGTAGLGDISAQRFTPAGARIGGEFTVNTYITGEQANPHFAMDGQGDFVVAWRDAGADGSGKGVRARRFRADGAARGPEFAVNTYTTGDQNINAVAAAVASDPVGNFVVTWWHDYGIDPRDVFAQRYGGLHPSALAVDTAGNQVWEPAETADLRPSWVNANGAPQTVGGGLTRLTGPPGPTYAITDPTAVYPTLADGSSATCTDCYVVSVSAPSPRPTLHWDATAVETLTPDAHGQVKAWALHIGDSFSDVPRASSFYRFVETLLHRGVTAGCGGDAYCPASAVTREQMAVFLLRAKEASDYVPPACATPVFGDVPASSPFCRWIEELARRGVVAGCGSGNYCPQDAVTREQMAVFVLRTLDPALNPPGCTVPLFADVPASSPFCRWVEELARRGVVTGCGGGNYCPAAAVTREQMSVFLTVAFGLTLYGP